MTGFCRCGFSWKCTLNARPNSLFSRKIPWNRSMINYFDGIIQVWNFVKMLIECQTEFFIFTKNSVKLKNFDGFSHLHVHSTLKSKYAYLFHSFSTFFFVKSQFQFHFYGYFFARIYKFMKIIIMSKELSNKANVTFFSQTVIEL